VLLLGTVGEPERECSNGNNCLSDGSCRRTKPEKAGVRRGSWHIVRKRPNNGVPSGVVGHTVLGGTEITWPELSFWERQRERFFAW